MKDCCKLDSDPKPSRWGNKLVKILWIIAILLFLAIVFMDLLNL